MERAGGGKLNGELLGQEVDTGSRGQGNVAGNYRGVRNKGGIGGAKEIDTHSTEHHVSFPSAVAPRVASCYIPHHWLPAAVGAQAVPCHWHAEQGVTVLPDDGEGVGLKFP